MYDKGILSEKVAGNIRSMIQDKDLKPGDKLPNEIEMTNILNVSRSTLREAIKTLVSVNVLEVRRGRGTFVSDNPGVSKDPLGVDFMEEGNLLKHFFEMRLLMEPQMVELAIERGTDEDIEEIKNAFNEVEVLLNNKENHTMADIHFHNAIAKATKNPIMERVLPIINNGIEGGYSQTKDTLEASETVRKHHRKIMKAIENRDGELAREAMIEHIKYGMNEVSKKH